MVLQKDFRVSEKTELLYLKWSEKHAVELWAQSGPPQSRCTNTSTFYLVDVRFGKLGCRKQKVIPKHSLLLQAP